MLFCNIENKQKHGERKERGASRHLTLTGWEYRIYLKDIIETYNKVKELKEIIEGNKRKFSSDPHTGSETQL